MSSRVHPRLDNLLASLSLNLAGDTADALERATGLTGSATAALLALQEFLDQTHIGRLADVLGLTHSGAVRLVTQLESAGLATRSAGTDRRRVQVRLTALGRDRAGAARAARDSVLRTATHSLTDDEAGVLEELLAKLIAGRVAERVERRQAQARQEHDAPGSWWCRTCDFAACGRPEGRCPAQATAARITAAGRVRLPPVPSSSTC